MLELKRIIKDYPVGGETVHALRGIDLRFRKSEFVSILGPSGCGKTTLLNLIGGLDRYTDGDLVINGVSTKKYKARDWDTYRNHSIGFVFQSYNLIPHQTVLQNVELSLTLSGVSKAERRKRAKKALEDVGLGEQCRKKPGQLSGGQMQRVAIARALVNNPDIILADEPTGALDTATSKQVMDILKEVSKDRLVIVVTHNPELAESYSTRIIRMLDGLVTDDSMPVSEEEMPALDKSVLPDGQKKKNKQRKTSMSLFTSFGLSLKNLFTKKGRTLLVSFAGSIGIIGIALIYAVSQGATAYINSVQEDTLSSYPLTLEASHMDLSSLLETFMGAAKSQGAHEKDAVYQKDAVYDLVNSLNQLEADENDLASFKTYLEKQTADAEDTTGLHENITGVQYSYDLDLSVYTKDETGEIVRSDTQELMQKIIAQYMGVNLAGMNLGGNSSMMSMYSGRNNRVRLWQELLPELDGSAVNSVLDKQYDLLAGRWPSAFDEIVLFVDKNNELDDMTLYALGLKTSEDIGRLMDAAMNGTELSEESRSWSYDEIMSREYRLVLNSSCYRGENGVYADLRESGVGMTYLYDNGIPLKVVGILRPSEKAVSSMMNGAIGYTHLLTEHVVECAKEAPAVLAQLASPNIDILTGLPFKDTGGMLSDSEKEAYFRQYVSEASEQGLAELYLKISAIPPEEFVTNALMEALAGTTPEQMRLTLSQMVISQMNVGAEDVEAYIGGMTDENVTEMYTQLMLQQISMQYAESVREKLSSLSQEQLAAAMRQQTAALTAEQCVSYYDSVLEFSDSDYEANLLKLGSVDLNSPAKINLFTDTFAGKDVIEDAIAAYNDSVDEAQKIAYTDYVGLIMSSVTTIIDAITYILIAFVAISLIVSSIMIAVITLISVQERTKEIGILRAIGASRKDVSGMFFAETVLIGFAAGLVGVAVTYLLCIPINAIIHHLSGIDNLSAFLPVRAAAVLVFVSVILTLFAGIIPSRSAAKKDPVVALRTE